MVNEVSLVQAAVSPLVTLATTYNLTIFLTSSNTRQQHTHILQNTPHPSTSYDLTIFSTSSNIHDLQTCTTRWLNKHTSSPQTKNKPQSHNTSHLHQLQPHCILNVHNTAHNLQKTQYTNKRAQISNKMHSKGCDHKGSTFLVISTHNFVLEQTCKVEAQAQVSRCRKRSACKSAVLSEWRVKITYLQPFTNHANEWRLVWRYFEPDNRPSQSLNASTKNIQPTSTESTN